MATFTKVQNKSGITWKAVVRKKGLSPLYKTFIRKTDARAWAKRIEGDNEQCRALGNRKVSCVTLSNLIDNYVKQYRKKDLGRFAILAYWKQRIGHVKVVDLNFHLIMDERDKLLNERGKRCGKNRLRGGSTVNRSICSSFTYWTPPPC